MYNFSYLPGSTFKTQSPIFKVGSAEEFLHFLYQFIQVKIKLGYAIYQKLESRLDQMLYENAQNNWNTIKNTVQPNSQRVPIFHELITAHKKTIHT